MQTIPSKEDFNVVTEVTKDNALEVLKTFFAAWDIRWVIWVMQDIQEWFREDFSKNAEEVNWLRELLLEKENFRKIVNHYSRKYSEYDETWNIWCKNQCDEMKDVFNRYFFTLWEREDNKNASSFIFAFKDAEIVVNTKNSMNNIVHIYWTNVTKSAINRDTMDNEDIMERYMG